MTGNLPPGDFVQDVVARADRRRRAFRALVRIVRLAPWAGAAAVVVALVARLAGAPLAVTVATVVALLLGLVGAFVWLLGSRADADAVAARVDSDVGLAGELRSAHWFARHPQDDEWTAFHLERATERARQIDWQALYPRVRAGRTWLLTAAGLAAALVIAMTMPAPDRGASVRELASGELLDADLLASLPPELRQQLEELLRQVAEGGMSGEMAEATLAELQELMKDVDPALGAKLAELAKQAADMAEGGAKPPGAEADLAKNTSAGLPEDVRWAIDDLAERLANASRDRQTNENNPAASEGTGEMGAGSEQAASSEGSADDMQMKLSREAASEAGAGKMMMSGAGAMGAMGGDSRQGAGGNNGAADANAPDPLSIAQALRQELVEASADTRGKNVEKEDIRRQTEQGEATLGFTRVAPPPNVDRSRAQAPPVVPDARRALLLNYFIRHQ